MKSMKFLSLSLLLVSGSLFASEPEAAKENAAGTTVPVESGTGTTASVEPTTGTTEAGKEKTTVNPTTGTTEAGKEKTTDDKGVIANAIDRVKNASKLETVGGVAVVTGLGLAVAYKYHEGTRNVVDKGLAAAKEQIEDIKNDSKKAAIVGAVGLGVAGLGAAYYTESFPFGKETEEAKKAREEKEAKARKEAGK